ncbi:MAG: hypothetical protein EOS86_16125 [Mesorhizobium sp.]|nr:MAG: hypothetical protein EOS86_16125 [Mesorhizobium sp.]
MRWRRLEDLTSGPSCSVAPPSVLPDISPTWGEIGSFIAADPSSPLAIGESRACIQSPPRLAPASFSKRLTTSETRSSSKNLRRRPWPARRRPARGRSVPAG